MKVYTVNQIKMMTKKVNVIDSVIPVGLRTVVVLLMKVKSFMRTLVLKQRRNK